MYPIFNIFDRTVGSYAVCAVTGFIVCGILAWRLGKRIDLAFEDILLMLAAAVAGLLLGGHILYGITNIGGVVDTLNKISDCGFKETLKRLSMYFGGSVFYGGFIGGTFSLLIYARVSKSVDTADVMDIWAVSVPLFHAFGRVGCFLGGCCYGVESHIGFIANGNYLVPELNGVRRFPTALVEAVCNLCIFAVLFILTHKNILRGKRIYIYMLIYAPVRFLLEFLRGDKVRGFVLGLSTSQWISIMLVVFCILRLYKARKHGKFCVLRQ